MSSRTVTRMALAGLLSMAFAAPIAAQTTPPFAVSRTGTLVLPGSYSTIPPVELAPMPREAAKHGEIRVSIQFGGPKLIELKYEQKIYGEMPKAPMPHANYRGPCAAEDIIHGEGVILPTFGTAPPTVQAMPVTPEPVRGDFFFEEVIPGRVVSRPAVRLAQCLPDGYGRCTPQVEAMPSDMRVAYPRAVVTMLRCDESGTWWVESRGVPQPKHAQSQQNWYYGMHPIAQAPAPAAKPACCAKPCTTSGDAVGTAVGLGVGALTGSPRVCCEQTTTPFTGTWVREVDGAVIAATLSPCGGELKLCITQNVEGETICLTVLADCKVMKDGLLHGVITGVDVETKRPAGATGESPLASVVAEMTAGLQKVVDAPFSIRLKETSAGLMVSNLKMGNYGPISGDEISVLCGMFKPCKDGVAPAAKPTKVRVSMTPAPPDFDCPVQAGCGGPPVMQCPFPPGYGAPGPMLCPPPPGSLAPVPYPAVGYGFTPPVPVRPAPMSWNPGRPVNVPPGEFGMMLETFGQMAGMSQPAPGLPPPPPMSTPIQVQAVGFPPIPQAVPNAPCPLPASTRPSITGTWVRQMGPQMVVVKIAPEHLTMSVTMSVQNEEGESVRAGWVITGDYHLSRDGTTLVGLLTSADVQIEGDFPVDDMATIMKSVAKLQKAMCDQPFAMTVRVYGDSLVIGNVRMPEVEDNSIFDAPASALFAGQYQNNGDKPLPKPKPMKEKASRATAPCRPPAACPASTEAPAATQPSPTPPYPTLDKENGVRRPPGNVIPTSTIPTSEAPPPPMATPRQPRRFDR